jgi:hypothetical protein
VLPGALGSEFSVHNPRNPLCPCERRLGWRLVKECRLKWRTGAPPFDATQMQHNG